MVPNTYRDLSAPGKYSLVDDLFEDLSLSFWLWHRTTDVLQIVETNSDGPSIVLCYLANNIRWPMQKNAIFMICQKWLWSINDHFG